RWCGFDFGGTMIDPRKNYQSWIEVINEIYTELGKPEVINEKVARFDELLTKYEYDERLMDGIVDDIELWKRYYRLKRLRETDMQKFLSYILDNDRDAIELFRGKSFRFLKIADGLKECLAYLKDNGVSVNIVSDVGSEGTIKTISNILSIFDLTPYFSEIITNYGRIKNDGNIDLSYKGMEKIDGTIYKKLARELLDIGINPSQALIIGDRPVEDVEKAKENGFKAIQFMGIMKRRVSKVADYVISDLRELKKIL
ncbi:MAG: HAD family hydrolase, partial [Hadesarchaea archaeon]|nr:HAD family hydrolase [Hadesarchaea archaeon]